MRAVVMPGSWHAGSCDPDLAAYELLDCPFVQHVAEYILDSGIRNLDFVLPASFPAIAEILGSGDRWGGVFRYFTASCEEGAYKWLRQMGADNGGEQLLLARLDCLPHNAIRASARAESSLFCYVSGQERTWTGWGIVPAEHLRAMPAAIKADEDLFAYLVSRAGSAAMVPVEQPLWFRSFGDVLESNRRALFAEVPRCTPHARQMAPGIWKGRNVSVHSTAVLQEPVLIDENAQIGRNVRLGPYTVIGADCVIEEGTVISHSVICRGTYVGARLDVKSAVVHRNTFADTTTGARLEGLDARLFGSVYEMTAGVSARMIGESLLACAALLFGLPILILLLVGVLAGVFRLQRRPVIKTPTSMNPACWVDFDVWRFESAFTSFELPRLIGLQMPALIPVVVGRLRLTGPYPPSREELAALLPHDRLTRTQEPAGVFRTGPFVELTASLEGKSTLQGSRGQRKAIADA